MSHPDEPDKKPPPQRTVAWNPADIPGFDEPDDATPPERKAPTASQPTIAWNPDDLPAESGAAKDEEDPLVGTLLRGKWRVLKKLGAGSFGTVYKVQDIKGGWIEALKILGVDRLSGADADNMRKRFLREAQIMKRLGGESSHIVGLSTYEEDIEAGLIYFLMEFVEGKSLADALAEQGPFPAERVIELGLQVCDALIAAHEGSDPVVHRDLKLENLMLATDRSGEETVKVLDFGIAKIAEREADSRLTTVGTLGTPGYAAPEQLRAEDVDGRTDLFAFGVILYALLTGRDPWLGHIAHQPTNKIYELMAATDRGEVRPIHESGVDIPPAISNIVLRLLKRNPDERFQSARELRDALNRVAAGGAATDAGSLRVLSNRPGVKVEIRSGRTIVAQGPTPCVANGVSAGTYQIHIRDPRYEPLETSVTLSPGAVEDVTIVARPRGKGVGAAAKRRRGVLTGGLGVIVALAGVLVVQPWGRDLDGQALLRRLASGTVSDAWLVDGGLDGVMSVGPFTTPFHVPVAEGDIPGTLRQLRDAGLDVDAAYEVRRLTELAETAQGLMRYFGFEGGDVRTYAQRLEALQPGSSEARSLRLKVAERMAWDADDAVGAGSVEAARTLLQECLALVPGHPRCTEVAERLGPPPG